MAWAKRTHLKVHWELPQKRWEEQPNTLVTKLTCLCRSNSFVEGGFGLPLLSTSHHLPFPAVIAPHHSASTALKKFVSTDYSVYDKIIVWHGWSSKDLMTLCLMSVLIERNLYHIDIRDCSTFMSRMSSTPFPGMGHVSSDSIQEMIPLTKPVSAAEKQKYQKQWHKWIHSKHP